MNQENHGSDNEEGEAGMSGWKECTLTDVAIDVTVGFVGTMAKNMYQMVSPFCDC